MNSSLNVGTDYFLGEAEKSFSRGDFSKARDYFTYLLQKGQKDLRTFLGLGKTYLALDKPDKSLEFYLQAMECEPNNPRVILETAILFLNNKMEKKAIELLNKGQKIDPNPVEWGFWKGMVYQSSRNFKKAREAFQNVLEEFPGHYPSLLELGTLELFQNKNLEVAEFLFSRARKLAPWEFEPYLYLGVVGHKKGNNHVALKMMRKSLKIFPGNELALYYLTQIYRELNLPLRALSTATKLLQKFPGEDDYRLLFMDLLNSLGMDEKLQEFCLNILTKNKNFLPSYEYLAILFRRSGESQLAEKCEKSIENILGKEINKLLSSHSEHPLI